MVYTLFTLNKSLPRELVEVLLSKKQCEVYSGEQGRNVIVWKGTSDDASLLFESLIPEMKKLDARLITKETYRTYEAVKAFMSGGNYLPILTAKELEQLIKESQGNVRVEE